MLEQISSVSEIAAKEFSLEDALKEMEVAWETIEFVCLPYRDTGACPYNRPCAQQYVGKSQSCMVRSGRLIVHAPVPQQQQETVLPRTHHLVGDTTLHMAPTVVGI